MRPRRVLYLMGTLHAGGAERQALTLVKGLDRSRWEPIVCGARGGALAEEFTAAAPTHVLDKRHKVDPGVVVRLRAVYDQYQPSVVHAYMSTANTWGRVAALLRPYDRPVFIASERGIETWKTPIHLLADRMLLGVTDAVVSNSLAVASYLREHDRVPPHLLHTIPNGIDLVRAQKHLDISVEERASLRAKLGFRPEHFVIGHIGRPDPVKRLDVLVEVFRRFHSEHRAARLLRVGRASLPKERAAAEQFGRAVVQSGLSDAVRDHPFMPDVSAALAAMDAVVQTSEREGLPNVVMEAMAMEVPVVVTAAGGTPELLRHRQEGWIVPVGDVEGLVAGLRHVLTEPGQAHRWAASARRRIETEYSVEAMVARTTALYERLLARRYQTPLHTGHAS